MQGICTDLKEGIYSCYSEEWSDEPIIGRIIGQSAADSIQVRWYHGTYKRKWKASLQRHNGEYVPWVDNIGKTKVLLNLTAPVEEFCLEKHVIEKLKELYAQHN